MSGFQRSTRLLLIASTGLFLGCASTLPPALPVEHAPPPVPEAVILPAAPPALEYDPFPDDPVDTIERANRQARLQPTRRGFQQGMMRYAFKPFAIYTVPTAIDTETRIFLAPGERLVYWGMADTKRWMAEETFAGDGESKQTIIVVKPLKAKLRTTATMTTRMGAYLLELSSNQKTYLAAVSWTHTTKQEAKRPREPSDTRYQMRILSGSPNWLPKRVWDVGLGGKTFVELPEMTAVTAEPLIYARVAGSLERVNHRLVAGTKTTFELDRLADAWELRDGPVGDDHAQVVQIERIGAY